MKGITIKQIRSTVRAKVQSMLNQAYRAGMTVSLADCIDASRKSLREVLVVRNCSDLFNISSQEFDLWIESADKEIAECAESCYMHTMASIKSKEIARVGASSIVEAILKEKGIDGYFLERQVHGLKVMVPLPNGRSFRFQIRYNRLQEDLSHVDEGIDAAIRLSRLFGRAASII